MRIHVTDLNARELDPYVRLTGAQLRRRLEPEEGIFIAESPTVIAVALDAGYTPVSMLTDERLIGSAAVRDIAKRLEDRNPNFPIYTVPAEILSELVGFALTRGALAVFHRGTESTVDEVLKDATRVAILESITDSTNVGALFRSAAALGIDAVLVTPSCCDPLCRRALRVSMGTVLLVPRARIGECAADWPDAGIEKLHAYGFKTVSMALRHDTVDIDDPRLASEEKLAVILGTEGTGLTEETISLSDYTVKIPMENGVDSLNVGAAGAIAFWQLTRKKKK